MLDQILIYNPQSSELQYQINDKFKPELSNLNVEIKQSHQNLVNYVQQYQKQLKIEIQLVQYQQGFAMESKKIELDQAIKALQISNIQYVSCKNKSTSFQNYDFKQLNIKHQSLIKQYKEEEQIILHKIQEIIMSYQQQLYNFSQQIGQLDFIYSLYRCKQQYSWIFPILKQNNQQLNIQQFYHPLLNVETNITNDFKLENNSMSFITGPNMGGKSTVLRSIGIIALLTQIGSSVPCNLSCNIPLFSSIQTRVGASDNQIKGISTFMQEILEIQNILSLNEVNLDDQNNFVYDNQQSSQNFTNIKPLILIDELGRGTSSKEGFGIACAVAENLIKKNWICLFATHFFEICLQFEANNFQMNYDHINKKFMYKLLQGICYQSFGLQIMDMLGFDKQLIEQADQMLKILQA